MRFSALVLLSFVAGCAFDENIPEKDFRGKVILPAGFGGILTGVLLAVARIAGETAPLIVTSFGSFVFSMNMAKPMSSLPIAIYRYAQSPYEELVNLAWTGALIITIGVLILNIASRVGHHLVSRGRR